MALSESDLVSKIEKTPLTVDEESPPRLSCGSIGHTEPIIRPGDVVFAIYSTHNESVELEKICCEFCDFQSVYESISKENTLYIVEGTVTSTSMFSAKLSNVFVWDVYKKSKEI
jgi:hypothetical protein